MSNSGKGTVYFLGIGGIGMSALARYYQSKGWIVAGYDRTRSPLTEQMEKEGMAIHYADDPSLLPTHIDKVIYTPAVPHDLSEIAEINRRGLTLIKRAAALGEISKTHFTIAVAGTHGKTTTTAMTAHILKECGVDTTAFIGGIAKNFGSNLHIGKTDKAILVVEADEFDRSFLHLDPNISIVNSIDADHLDIYGDRAHLIESFNEFANLTQQCVIAKEGLDVSRCEVPQKAPCRDSRTELCSAVVAPNNDLQRFGFGEANDFRCHIVNTANGFTDFNIVANGDTTLVHLPLAGQHNVLNATAAFAAARQIGLESEAIAQALSTFKGVKRRFDVRIRTNNYIYIDDYAHHPEEIKSCLSAIKTSFPSKRVTVVFQPHLFTRTRDFMEDFAKSLAMADSLILLDIYPAREQPIEGVTSEALLEKVQLADKRLCKKENLLTIIDQLRPELLVTVGAGDIDRFVEPLEKMMSRW